MFVCISLGAGKSRRNGTPVILEATDSSALKIVPFEILSDHAYKRR